MFKQSVVLILASVALIASAFHKAVSDNVVCLICLGVVFALTLLSLKKSEKRREYVLKLLIVCVAVLTLCVQSAWLAINLTQ